MVNLAGRTLPYGPAKNLKFILLQNCLLIYRQLFQAFIASKSLKLSFTLDYVLKRANDLKNDFKLTRFASEVRQKFEAVPHE